MVTGNWFLDHFFGGLSDDDFILAGSFTGKGKTSLANILCADFAANEIKPAFLSLENPAGDTIKKRTFQRWRELTRDFSQRYREWIISFNRGDDAARAAYKLALSDLKNIILREATTKTTVDMVVKMLDEVKEEGAEIIILDHFDFVALDESKNMYQEQTNFSRTLKEWIEKNRIPMIVFAHTSKRIPSDVKIPQISDFFGSGEKAKMCTGAFMLAPDRETDHKDPFWHSTFLEVIKDRAPDGKVGQGVRVPFDAHKNQYIWGQYEKIFVSQNGNKIKEAL